MKPGLLIASGGIDSTVLAYWLHQRRALVEMLFIDYGQASADLQAEFVQYHADKLKVPWRREMVDWPEHSRGRGFIFTDGHYPEAVTDAYEPLDKDMEGYQEYLEQKFDYLQGRNSIFLLRAGMYATHRGLEVVYNGNQYDQPVWDQIDRTGEANGDTSPRFIEIFNMLLKDGFAFSAPMRVECPFLDLRLVKSQIVAIGHNLSVNLTKTYSCEFFPICGECSQCVIRREYLRKPTGHELVF